MPPKPIVKYLVYAMVIVLSVVIVVLILISPHGFMENKSVYQGF